MRNEISWDAIESSRLFCYMVDGWLSSGLGCFVLLFFVEIIFEVDQFESDPVFFHQLRCYLPSKQSDVI